MRFGRLWLGEFPGGVWFCPLAAATSVDGMLQAVAGTLNVPLGSGDPVTQLANAIAARGRCLVILDNFEQMPAQGREVLAQWMQRTVEAAFLVTSRDRLALRYGAGGSICCTGRHSSACGARVAIRIPLDGGHWV